MQSTPSPSPTGFESKSRRRFLRDGSLLLLASAAAGGHSFSFADDNKPRVRVGLVTDLHYADKPPAGSRYYHESLVKLEEAARQYEQEKPELMVELGDFIDSADSLEAEKKHLAQIHKAFSVLPGEKHYVLGNHCVTTLTKSEFLEGVGQERSFYSFDRGVFHFVVLDACYRSDGEPYGRDNFHWTDAFIPQDEVEWLKADLKKATGKTIVFAHQRLDLDNHYAPKNAADVRAVLEQSGNVVAVFQGHSHKNDHKDINGIHYCTLVAMIEGSGEKNNGYSLLDIHADGSLRLQGWRKQSSYDWKQA